MKTRNIWTVLLIAAGFTFIGTSCSKDSEIDVDNSKSATVNKDSLMQDSLIIITAGDEAQAANLSDQIVSEADYYANITSMGGYMGVKGISGANGKGPTVTIDRKDSINFPKTITIDFGAVGDTCKRGKDVVLKGKLIVVISDRMWKPGSIKTITFDNFYVNDNKIAGSKTVTYNGLNAQLQPSWTISVTDTITRADGTVVVWNSLRTRTRIDNGGTPLKWNDDTYAITGGSSGINAKGKAFTMTIDPNNPLIAYSNYPFFVKGVLTIVSEDKTAVLNYGNGTKDNKGTVTVNGVTKEIILRK